MTGHQYADLISKYILFNFSYYELSLYREVRVGKSNLGNNRIVDIFITEKFSNDAFIIECKYQESSGTVDQKIIYALEDLKSIGIGGCLCYAGNGFSPGILNKLQSDHCAAYCLPNESFNRDKNTIDLDHALAIHFQWWALIIRDKAPIS